MFYYRIGNISTTIPWYRPTIKAFGKWADEWLQTPGIENYNIHLCGGFAQICYFLNESLLKTWDVDIMLTGKVNTNLNYGELKRVLDEAQKIGFKHRLLIDIRYISNGLNPIVEGVEFKFKDYYVTIRNNLTSEKRSAKENYKKNYIKDKNGYTAIELIPGLYKLTKDPKPNWEKYKSKNYKGPSYISLSPKTQ